MITVLILCLGIFAGLLCACGTPSAGKGAAEETSSEKDNNSGGAEKKMVLHEPEFLKLSEIEAVYTALSRIKVGKPVENIGGRMWHMTFGYTDPAYNFSQDTYLSFKGNYIKLGSEYYELENIEELYGSLDCEIFKYMKDFSDAPALKPVY